MNLGVFPIVEVTIALFVLLIAILVVLVKILKAVSPQKQQSRAAASKQKISNVTFKDMR